MEFKGRDIVSIKDFSREELIHILNVADLMEPIALKGSDTLSNRIMASLFFEPSTRTRLSFHVAMYRLGGTVIGFSSAEAASVEKGETLADTIRTVENYADVIVLRHPLEGASRFASEIARIPVINAGSGSEEHPTQALIDIYTIKRERGQINGLNIGILGDLRYARTVHSLLFALSNFNVNLFLISPPLLKLRGDLTSQLKKTVKIVEVENVGDVLNELDVLYVTRIQKERFVDPSEYLKVKDSYKITPDILRKAKPDLLLLHPLPRIGEIDYEVDLTAHAKYFDEVRYGIWVRMALLALVLGAVE
jgi:aspartate carbamoyltransferase catalytic subunit